MSDQVAAQQLAARRPIGVIIGIIIGAPATRP